MLNCFLIGTGTSAARGEQQDYRREGEAAAARLPVVRGSSPQCVTQGGPLDGTLASQAGLGRPKGSMVLSALSPYSSPRKYLNGELSRRSTSARAKWFIDVNMHI